MMCVAGRLGAKLRDCHGESLVEALVALLISTMGILMLATSIVSAVRIIDAGKRASETYYSSDAKLASLEDAGSHEAKVKVQCTTLGGTVGSSLTGFQKSVDVQYTEVDLPGSDGSKGVAYKVKEAS